MTKIIIDGVGLIQLERARQQQVEGYDQEHDDEHVIMRYGSLTRVPLVDAAVEYARAGRAAQIVPGEAHRLGVPEFWPWASEFWKPSDNPIRNLVKAGALIAAEIDRLQRLEP